MNGDSSEMLHCMDTPGNLAGNSTDMSPLERQPAHMKWQQEHIQQQFQLQQTCFNNNEPSLFSMPAQSHRFLNLMNNDGELGELVTEAMKHDPDMDTGWPDFRRFGSDGLDYGSCGLENGPGFEMNYAISRTASCPPAVAAAAAAAMAQVMAADNTESGSVSPEKLSSAMGRESFKKRKADKPQNQKVAAQDITKEKKMKGCAEEGDSKITEENSNNREASADTSKENSKVSEARKPDYIHVRARRGQATDSHSLAERVRREKISKRMKYLQDLVPGCNKITGKAGMLDEIINYVQSLQRQVEFLSMKLAAINPRLDLNIDNLFMKEMYPPCTSNFPIVASELANPASVQFNALQQVVSCGSELGLTTSEMALRRSINAPVSNPDAFFDSSSLNQILPSSIWDAELQSLYGLEFQQGRSTSFPSQSFTGSIAAGNLKMEM